MQPIDFWFSIGSTYTYLSVMRLPEVVRLTGQPFRWRPFDVRRVMLEQNNIPFRDKPVKLAYMWRDLDRRAAARGLAPSIPAPYPLANLTFANEVALLGMREGWGEAYVTETYRRWFERGEAAGDAANLSGALLAIGQDPERVRRAASRSEIAQALATETDTARDLGVFGSPSFVVAGEVVWGDDRLEDALDWASVGAIRHLAGEAH